MTHPYIDCARRLAARGIQADDIAEITCEVAQGTVHRLWDPLPAKQRPNNGYAGKFSTPYCIAYGFVHGSVGLSAFTDEAVKEQRVLALASKVRYVIDPDNPYPNNYTGHLRATLRDGQVIEERQPHLRGGAHEPLSRADIEDKFARNARHGGWQQGRIDGALLHLRRLFDTGIDFQFMRG
jgi:2-methylcitrate dehydratase PrpD